MEIPYEDFSKVELRTAKIEAAERVPGSEKLLKLLVDAGTEKRQIVAGIGKAYEPDSLVGKTIVIVANLAPRKLMGEESQGMLLAASAENPVLLTVSEEVPPGSPIR